MGAMANTPDWDENLQEHLLNQWALMEMDDLTRRGGEATEGSGAAIRMIFLAVASASFSAGSLGDEILERV